MSTILGAMGMQLGISFQFRGAKPLANMYTNDVRFWIQRFDQGKDFYFYFYFILFILFVCVCVWEWYQEIWRFFSPLEISKISWIYAIFKKIQIFSQISFPPKKLNLSKRQVLLGTCFLSSQKKKKILEVISQLRWLK